jgi:hypothetical protein
MHSNQSLIMSSSLDGYVCLWNIESSRCVNRLETPHQVLGMGALRQDVFYFYSQHGIHIYSITRAWTSFATIRSTTIQLNRVEDSKGFGKILILAGDASLRLISPLNGASLATAMPYMSMIDPLCSVYSSEEGTSSRVH